MPNDGQPHRWARTNTVKAGVFTGFNVETRLQRFADLGCRDALPMAAKITLLNACARRHAGFTDAARRLDVDIGHGWYFGRSPSMSMRRELHP
jgi:hypothetical protein